MNRSILLYFIAFLIISGCSKDKALDALKPSLTIDQDVYEFLNTDLVGTIPITANVDWDVALLAEANWITVTKNGDQVNLTITKNDGVDERVAKLKVANSNNEVSQIIIIKQHGDVPTLIVNPASLIVEAEGSGAISVEVKSNMMWAASSNASWCVITPEAKAIKLLVQANTQSGPRTAVITLTGERPEANKTIVVRQKGTVDISIDKTALTFTRESQTLDVVVTSNRVWTYEIPTTTTWLTAVQEGNKLKLTAAENTLLERTSTVSVLVADVKIPITVKQAGYGLNTADLDRATLILIFKTMNGVNWSNKWDITKPLNSSTVGVSWPGVTINTATNRVTQIDLNNTPLGGGAIPSEIGYLSALTDLRMVNCGLTGNLPTSMGDLVNLGTLLLQSNKITGSIPIEFAKLTKLGSFFINGNQLSGVLPSNVLSKIPGLNLHVNGNNLSGVIPQDIKSHPKWASWTPATNICPQNLGYGFTNCP